MILLSYTEAEGGSACTMTVPEQGDALLTAARRAAAEASAITPQRHGWLALAEAEYQRSAGPGAGAVVRRCRELGPPRCAHRLSADDECRGDLAVDVAACDEGEDFGLARGETKGLRQGVPFVGPLVRGGEIGAGRGWVSSSSSCDNGFAPIPSGDGERFGERDNRLRARGAGDDEWPPPRQRQ